MSSFDADTTGDTTGTGSQHQSRDQAWTVDTVRSTTYICLPVSTFAQGRSPSDVPLRAASTSVNARQHRRVLSLTHQRCSSTHSLHGRSVSARFSRDRSTLLPQGIRSRIVCRDHAGVLHTPQSAKLRPQRCASVAYGDQQRERFGAIAQDRPCGGPTRSATPLDTWPWTFPTTNTRASHQARGRHSTHG